VSYASALQQEPWRFDYFAVLRRLERTFQDKPRIGDSAALREEYVLLGQDTYMDFPASNLIRVECTPENKFRIFVKFLGLLGPQGALPLATTEEVYSWAIARDDAFPRFLDLLHHRFLQLFFRAWADARPIAQHDRPAADRFVTYLGATIGIGSPLYLDLDSVPDAAKLGHAGVLSSQTRSASRLRNLIGGLFGVEAEIEEFVGSYLTFDAADRSSVGQRNSALGGDLLIGTSVFSVQDKFRIRIYTRTLKQYMEFLPSGGRCEPLADLIYFYVGEQLDYEVELALPIGEVVPTRLGRFGQLGYTSWMAPNWADTKQRYRCDARFHPAEIMKEIRRKRQSAGEGNGRYQP
jgi:type VI secretion system protein ImpH